MPSTSDLRTYSTQILGSLQQIDTLLGRVTTSGSSADEISDITTGAQAIIESLTKAHTGLRAIVGNGPSAHPDPQEARRETAVARAELPLEPAIAAVRQIPQLIEKASASGATNAVLLVPLVLASRHVLEALRPLVEAVDPADLAKAGLGLVQS